MFVEVKKKERNNEEERERDREIEVEKRAISFQICTAKRSCKAKCEFLAETARDFRRRG